MPIVLLDNYDSFTYNLYQMVQHISEEPVVVYRNDAIDFSGLKSLNPSAVILSPGPGHPGNPSDFGVCADAIREQETLGCPVLGICLGHQGIVHYLGGNVASAPEILHGKTSMIDVLKPSPLFQGMDASFKAMRYHSLVAADENFPDVLEVIAREQKNGLIMAIQHREKPIYGLQFHPESIGTPEGKQILRNFVEKC